MFLTYIIYVDLQAVDSNMSGVPPELLDIDWSKVFYSPMHHFCMPFPVADDSNYRDAEVPYQYGTNEAAAFTSELWGPMPNYPDAFLHNDPSCSQENLPSGTGSSPFQFSNEMERSRFTARMA